AHPASGRPERRDHRGTGERLPQAQGRCCLGGRPLFCSTGCCLEKENESVMTKVGLVTGAGSGIGRATALRLGDLGMDVAVHYFRSEEGAKCTVSKLREMGR